MHQPRTVAEAYLQALEQRGVEYIFGNAGTDFAPIIEALAGADDSGMGSPQAIEVIHETVAVAMAHGYYLMTGRPQVAMVHVNVGVANSLMGIINAYRGQVPVIFASGRTPLTEQGRLGSRNAPIHWGQEMFDQGGMLREFVKWDTELKAGEQVGELVERAHAIATSEPPGPVYLSLPREILAEGLPPDYRTATAQPTPSAPHPDPSAVAEAVRIIGEAEHPLIISSIGGEAVFASVSAFAERFAVPVCEFWRVSPTVSTEHPFFAGEVPSAELARADVVIALNALVPWMPERMPLRDDARVIHIGADPLFRDVPVRLFPADLTITSTVHAAIDAIGGGLAAAGHADSAATRTRRAQLVPELSVRRARQRDAGLDAGGTPMSPEFMSRTLSDTLGPNATIVNELGLATGAVSMTNWDSYFGPAISGGLGWGGGAAIGAKLATPDKTIVWTTGDGSYVFANPMAVHHAAASLRLGLLTVVADNRVWNAVRRSTIAVYPEGRAAAGGRMALTSLDPPPDYPKIVEAYGGHGEHVTDPDRLAPALERALEITATGRQALLSVHCSYPDISHH